MTSLSPERDWGPKRVHEAVFLHIQIGELIFCFRARSGVAGTPAPFSNNTRSEGVTSTRAALGRFPYFKIPTRSHITQPIHMGSRKMDVTTAARFETLKAYTADTATQEDGMTFPVLARFTIARGGRGERPPTCSALAGSS